MAISFVSAADTGDNNQSTNTYTTSFTISGNSNRFLVLGIEGDVSTGNTATPAVTYAGTAMNLGIKNIPVSSGKRVDYLFYQVDNGSLPAAGAHNFFIDFSPAANQFIITVAAEYSGVATSGQPDNTAASDEPGPITSNTSSITTVADNCWVVELQEPNSAGATAGAGATLRVQAANFAQPVLLDSGGAVHPAGSYSMTFNAGGTLSLGSNQTMMSFAPAAVGAVPIFSFDEVGA